MTEIKITDADTRATLGDAFPKFAYARGQMSSGDKSDPRFGAGQDGLRNLVAMFDCAASDPRASAAERAECGRARDIVAGTLAGLESVAR